MRSLDCPPTKNDLGGILVIKSFSESIWETVDLKDFILRSFFKILIIEDLLTLVSAASFQFISFVLMSDLTKSMFSVVRLVEFRPDLPLLTFWTVPSLFHFMNVLRMVNFVGAVSLKDFLKFLKVPITELVRTISSMMNLR